MHSIGAMRATGRCAPYRKQYSRKDGGISDLTLALAALPDELIFGLTANLDDDDALETVERGTSGLRCPDGGRLIEAR